MDWIKKIDQLLVELDKRPQFRFQALLLKPLENKLSRLLGFNVQLELHPKGWQKREELSFVNQIQFSLFSPVIEDLCYFSADQKSIRLLLEDPILSASNSEMVKEITESFLYYLLLESFVELQKQQELSSLSLTLQKEEKIDWSEESYFCFEILCKSEISSALFNLYIPPSFRTSFEEHFAHMEIPMSNEMKESIFLELSLEVGRSLIKESALQRIEKGDFLLLDQCLYDPEAKKGSFLLVLDDTPIFRGKVTKEGCKLAEIPVYQEVGKMENDEEDFFFEEESEEEQNKELANEDSLTGDEPQSLNPALLTRIDNIELNVKIELCRIQMNIKNLSELSIGNLLPLDVSIDKGVDLVVNGKRFAKGELLRMGEQLGVRILEIIGK